MSVKRQHSQRASTSKYTLLIVTGPAAMVRPVWPWPYRILREKNGVAWILTYTCVIIIIIFFFFQ